MNESKFQICSNCSEKNNPSFIQCWKCGYWFVQPTPEMLSRLEDIKKSNFHFGLCLSGFLISLIGFPFLTALAIKWHWLNSRTANAVGIIAMLAMFLIPVLISQKWEDERASLVNGMLIGAAIVLMFASLCGPMWGYFR